MVEPTWWFEDKALEVELGRRVCAWLILESAAKIILRALEVELGRRVCAWLILESTAKIIFRGLPQ